MNLQAAHPEPTTTTLGFTSVPLSVASVLNHAREANGNGFNQRSVSEFDAGDSD
jgi:hypothetical protein